MSLMVLCIITYAQNAPNPIYIIDFDVDEPEIKYVSPQITEVTGNVLINETKEPAGFGYKITMTLSGGPASLNATPINFDFTGDADASSYSLKAAPSEFEAEKTRIGKASEGYFQTLLVYSLKGWVKDETNLDFTYYRDPSTKMRFELELDNGANLANVTYELGDMDYNFIGSSTSGGDCPGKATDIEDYSCRFSYIDQITVLSGVGSNEYSYDEAEVTQKGDVLYSKFKDDNDDQIVDEQLDGRVSFRSPAGNIAVYNPGVISKVIFDYDDPGFPIAAEANSLNGGSSSRNRAYHDFDSQNQLMYFLSGMTFDLSVCTINNASLAININSSAIPEHTLEANITGASNLSNNISYQWYSSTTDCEKDFELIAGADQATYNVTGLTAPTYFKVIAVELDQNGTELCNVYSDCFMFGSITGCVTEDTDRNGIDLSDTSPIPGTTVSLLSNTGTTINSLVTGADGKFAFHGLLKGEYIVSYEAPTGFDFLEGTPTSNIAIIDMVEDPARNAGINLTVNTALVRMQNQNHNQDHPIPTMSEWGLMIFGLLVLNISVSFLRRQEEIMKFS